MNSFDSFTLTPMSAGDVIDRAVRIYRRNFLALLRIVFGPSLVAYLGTVLYYIGMRNFSFERGESRVLLSVLLIVAGLGIWLFGKAAFYAVLGGASRSLVDHFFEGKPILARDVYRAVKERFWSLIGAMLVISLLLMGAGTIIYFLAAIAAMFVVIAAPLLSGAPNWLQATLTITLAVAAMVVIVFILLLIYSRVVYVPQVMMVEGKGVFNSISRSFSLASGGLWRITALLLFWVYVAWSAWVLLFMPLGSIAYWLGVDPVPFSQDIPVWYNVAYQTVTQISEILIAPIAMLGFTLLYLDSRVRKEGFDVELLANRLLPQTPQMAQPVLQQQPVFFGAPIALQSSSAPFPSILGLNDYAPIPQTRSEGTPESQQTFNVTANDSASQVGDVAGAGESNLTRTEASTLSSETTTMGVTEIAPDETIAASPRAPEPVQRSCRWCGTQAGDEDRFCRVCGSVF